MPGKKITLLDRAKADLFAAKSLLSAASGDDAVMDVCAYHCQQCVEKTAKFMILLQGDSYANDHRSDIYLEDLRNGDAVALIRTVSSKIDSWATTIRYHHAILSNKKMVAEVIGTCEKLISVAERSTPEEAHPPEFTV